MITRRAAPKIERTKPGSKNDFRVEYSDYKRWTNDRPGDGVGPDHDDYLRDLFSRGDVKRSLKKLEKATAEYIKSGDKKPVLEATDAMKLDNGGEVTLDVLRQVYKMEKEQLDNKKSEQQKKIVEALDMAKDRVSKKASDGTALAMATGITYHGYTTHTGGDATSRFTIRGQVYEYHMSKRDAEVVHWLKKKSVGKALNLAKKRAYDVKKANNERFYRMAYEFGQRTSKQSYNDIAYSDDGDFLERVVDDDWGNVFFEEGRDYPNKPFPKKTVGWRYGDIPKLRSWNAREQVEERGVSVMQSKGRKKLKGLYEIFNRQEKPIVFIEGYLLHSTGGDGEDLIAVPKVVKRPSGNWDISTNAIDEKFMTASEARKKFDLKQSYIKWNNKLFGGELPMLPFKWIRSKRVGGYVRVRMDRVTGEHTALVLAISDYLTLDENRFNQIMIHEMIHVWQALHNIEEPKGGHGRQFVQMARELGSKVGLKIPLTEDISKLEVSDAVSSKNFVVVLLDDKGKKGHMVFTESVWNSNENRFESELSKLTGKYGIKFTVVRSDDRGLLKATVKRQVLDKNGRISWYRSQPGFHEQILRGGKSSKEIKEQQEYDYSRIKTILLGIGKFLGKALEKKFNEKFTTFVDGKPTDRFGGYKITVTIASMYGEGSVVMDSYYGYGERSNFEVYWEDGQSRRKFIVGGKKISLPKEIMEMMLRKYDYDQLAKSFGS